MVVGGFWGKRRRLNRQDAKAAKVKKSAFFIFPLPWRLGGSISSFWNVADPAAVPLSACEGTVGNYD
jgi:hypothetical protein